MQVFLNDDLNPVQLEAVRQTEGPVIIFAGAGSGKTRVLTYRVAHLLQRGVSPFGILAVTFTNRASAEMRERVINLAGAPGRDVWISTFHSMSVRILRQEVQYTPYDRNFVICDGDDQETLVKHCIRELDLDDKKYRPRTLRSAIGGLKNNLVDLDEFERTARDERDTVLAKVYRLYQTKLLEQNALDFDDLLLQTVELFRANPLVLERYQHRFQYVMVDEYQDTNKAQYTLVHQIAAGFENLCVVGDDDQSIYGWRGADISNILEFERDYPEARIIKLEQNYRSTQRILTVANSVIANNKGRKPKQLWTSNRTGEPVCCYEAADERDEARFVLAMAERLRQTDEAQYRDCAVFYRTHAQSRSFEEECIRNNVPYRIFGGIRFYERREIKDILAYLRLVANPRDDISLRRILNVPRRGIGDTALGRAEQVARERGGSLGEVLADPELLAGLGRTGIAIKGFLTMVERWRQLQETMTVTAMAEAILEETSYRSLLESEPPVEAETRLENIKEFLGVTREYDEQAEDKSLSGFLEHLALVTDVDNYNSDENAIVLMSIHSAKGLEFPVVFLTGLEEGLFPHAHALGEEQTLEEERRLCYVGITRAREQLFLSWANRRFLHGSGIQKEPSRFLAEIPEEFLHSVTPTGAGKKAVIATRYGSPGNEEGVASNRKLPPVFTGRALLEAAAAGASVETRGESARGGSAAVLQGVAAGMAAGGKPAVQSADRADGQETPNFGDGGQNGQEFTKGDMVEHKKFGRGVVTEIVVGRGGDLEIFVRFETVGVKQLMVKFAPLARL
jgi:DNA helicase-2/ATP-dependent DNA helicase PcrA